MENAITDFSRYSRQIIIPEVGISGQYKLKHAKVLVVGTGGLGSPILYYLSAAGIGTLGLVDSDIINLSNLQRQILHWEKDIGRLKTDSAFEKLSAFNSQTVLKNYPIRLDIQTAREIFSEYNLIVAAVDNMETRDIINRVCIEQKKIWIEGAINQFTGLVTVFDPPNSPCYRCLYPNIPPKSDKPIGVIGTVPGVIGTLQAQEVVKIILDIGEPLIGRLLIYDALSASFDIMDIKKNVNCDVCK